MRFFSLFALTLASMVCSVANAQSPSDPPVFPLDWDEVGVIFAADADKYEDSVLRTNANGGTAADNTDKWSVLWTQNCTISADEVGDTGYAAIQVLNLDYLPIQFDGKITLTEYRYLHFDFWVPTECKFPITLYNWGEANEEFVSDVYTFEAGKWTSIDIDLSQFDWNKKNDEQQRLVNVIKIGGAKFDEGATPQDNMPTPIWFTNVIVHNESSIVAGIVNTEVSSVKSTASYNLAGQRVSAQQKGISIQKGKKVVK